MQQEQVVLDDPWTLGRAWGLGWILPIEGVVGHDGATYGQYAFYRLHPETGVAMALLTNGPGARTVFETLFAEFFNPLAGVTLPRTPVPSAEVAVDPARWVGTYERQEVRIDITEDLDFTMTVLGANAALAGPPMVVRLTGFEPDTLISLEPLERSGVHMTVKAIGSRPDGSAEWVHFGARATPRKP
jgi:hypothetical protein